MFFRNFFPVVILHILIFDKCPYMLVLDTWCVSLSVYVCVCLYVCTSVCVCVCLSVCMYFCLCTCVPVCVYVLLSVYVCACLCVCTSVCVCVCLSVCMYFCLCTCVPPNCGTLFIILWNEVSQCLNILLSLEFVLNY